MSTAARRSGLVVALDGPASSGKSSVGAGAASVLGYRFLDTGLLYRAATWLAGERGIAATDTAALPALASAIWLEADDAGRLTRVLVEGADVSEAIRSADVDVRVSDYAKVPELRAALLARQRDLARDGGIVVAGRDVGTVVLPDAEVKVFLSASAEVRARRRAAERGFGPDAPETVQIRDDLARRDQVDSTRAVAPLRAAPDAIRLDTDALDLDGSIAALVEIVRWSVPDLSPGDRLGWFQRATHAFGRWFLPRLTKPRRIGFERPLPRSGALLVACNHLSNADPGMIGSYLGGALDRRLYWLGKEEALRWPVLGWAVRQNGVLGVKRGGSDLDAFRIAKGVLDGGHVLIVFPEGTRSRTGTLATAKDGVGVLALRSGAPILPVAVYGTERLWPRGQNLPGRTPEVTIRVGTPFHLAPSGEGGDRRTAGHDATEQIMARIASLLPSDYRGPYAEAAERDPDPSVREIGAPLS